MQKLFTLTKIANCKCAFENQKGSIVEEQFVSKYYLEFQIKTHNCKNVTMYKKGQELDNSLEQKIILKFKKNISLLFNIDWKY